MPGAPYALPGSRHLHGLVRKRGIDMPHVMGESKSHNGHFLYGVDQGNMTNEGRAIIDCDGREGVIRVGGAHCSYGVTVDMAAGYSLYLDTHCVAYADDAVGRERLGHPIPDVAN
jgi:hypothetical protein